MIRAFIFDLDGTLIDSEILWVEAVAEFLRKRRLELPEEETLRLVYGRSNRDIFADLTQRFPELELDIEGLNDALRPLFLRLRDSRDVRIDMRSG